MPLKKKKSFRQNSDAKVNHNTVILYDYYIKNRKKIEDMASFKQIVDKVPTRMNIGVMIFFSIFFLYMLRAHFSINLLAMVQPIMSDVNDTVIELPDYGPRYAWNAYQQSLLLGAFFWGYAITSMPAGLLIDKYNIATLNVGYAIGISTILVAIGPVLAMSFVATLVQRFAIGLVSSGLAPSVFKIISKWSPPSERGKFLTSLVGNDVGTVVTWSLCGVLIENYGWQMAFYVPAMLSGVFTVLWFYFVFDSPAQHPRILPAEKKHIEQSLEGISEDLKSMPPLWSIAKSIPFYTLLILNYGHTWGMYFLLTAAPKFMNQALGYDLAASGFLASLPYVTRLFAVMVFGTIQDYLKLKNVISQNLIRKGFCLFSHIIPGLFLLGILFVSDQPLMCVAFITISYAFNGAVVMTGYANVFELSPNYVSSVFAIMNGFASTAGFLSPLIVAHFTKDGQSVDDWTTVFIIGALAYIVPAVLFMIFGSVQIQPWNEPLAKQNKISDACAAETQI